MNDTQTAAVQAFRDALQTACSAYSGAVAAQPDGDDATARVARSLVELVGSIAGQLGNVLLADALDSPAAAPVSVPELPELPKPVAEAAQAQAEASPAPAPEQAPAADAPAAAESAPTEAPADTARPAADAPLQTPDVLVPDAPKASGEV